MTLRVLHIELGRHLYGGAKQVTYLLNALADSNDIENHLLCPVNSEISIAPLSKCQLHTIAYHSETDLFALGKMMRICRSVKPDLIHIHSRRGADVWGALLTKFTKIPAICTRRVDNTESKFAKYKYGKYAAVASISHGVHEVVKQHCDNVQYQPVIHSSVDLTEFHHNADREWLHERFAIPKHHKVVANFAQLISRKGQADIVLAMKKVVQTHPDVTCLLFGKGKLQESYQALIEKMRLTEHVKLCGFTQKVAKILPCVDIVLHPAYTEGLGVILLQAGAAKRAVIACPVGGIPEIIHHEETGLMVSPGDINGISAAIERLLNDEELTTQLGERLFQHIKSEFSPQEMARRYLALYKQVCEKNA